MKKIILIVSLISLVTTNSFSQVKWGASVGINMSNVSMSEADWVTLSETKNRILGIRFGISTEIPLSYSTTFNTGMIYSEKNQLYRVFQKHDFDMYGASLGISKIKSLTENKYEEEIFIKILPDFFKNILGTHTFSFNSGILVNDFVKYEKID